MKYTFQLPDFPNSTFELEMSMWTGRSTLLMDSVPVERSKKWKKPFLIPTADGGHIEAFQGMAADFSPALIINGTKTRLAPKLAWYEYAIGALPVILLFIGGGLGGVIGALSVGINFNLLRQEGSSMAKYLKVIGVSVLAYIAYLVIAGWIYIVLK